jgi:Flp pilus assembly pilin Flp
MTFLKSRSGATSIEYGLIACFIGIVIISGIGAVGGQTSALFNLVSGGF